jgi:uncharacterized membrane protein
MLKNIPLNIAINFGFTTLATLILFYTILRKSHSVKVQQNANSIGIGLIIWLIIQAVLTLKNVYNTDNEAMPPKILVFGILPQLILIVGLFISSKGRHFIDSLPLKFIIWLNIVRIPVEIVLYWLFLNKAVPELMTFTGRNFDILAGITAPFLAYFGFKIRVPNRYLLLAWNILGLILLFNIVFLALFSAITPFQKFAFEQPNIAIVNFPFSWLPTFIVPVVLFGHLVSIRRLIRKP